VTISKLTLLALVVAASVFTAPGFAAPAGGGSSPVLAAASGQGSQKDHAACRPDVRRFCSKVKQGSDTDAFLTCLNANRAKLSRACLAVLQSHGV